MTQSAQTDPPVRFQELDASGGHRIGVATLARPRQLNALDLPMCRLLTERLQQWAADESVVCMLLDGEGDRGFCAGADVAAVARQIRAGGPRRFVGGDIFFETEYRLVQRVHEYPKPVVSWMHGVTMGGGLGLALGASHRIVSEGLQLAMPEIHIGLFPDVGAGWFLNRLPPGVGLLLGLTGIVLGEADALQTGLADWFVPSARRDALRQALVEAPWSGVARRDAAVLAAQIDRVAREAGAAPGALPEPQLPARAAAIRALGLLPDALAVREALAHAAARDAWFETAAANLAGGSPTTACVTFEYLRRARRLSLAQTLRLDLTLARACLRHHDFAEGVRARLIDKDRAPRWSPARIEDVPASLGAAHFADEAPAAG